MRTPGDPGPSRQGAIPEAERERRLRLFRKSVLKRAKLREILRMLGPTEGRRCLDLGSDNGVVSWHLRAAGGSWTSADLTEEAVASIREMVGDRVCRLEGSSLPFADGEFDAVVIVDLLEHLPDDGALLREAERVLSPGGRLVINVPHDKRGALLRPLRNALGLTDAWHGHLRPGYTPASLERLLPPGLVVEERRTYSRFFPELLDTALNAVYTRGGRGPTGRKGAIVTGGELRSRAGAFRLYSLLWPALALFARLDALVFFTRGYCLIVRARRR